MARQPKSDTAASPDVADKPGQQTETGAAAGGENLIRDWMHQSLLMTRGLITLIEQTQRLNAQTAAAWNETLAEGARQVEQANDFNELIAVPPHVASRQWDQALRILNETSQQLFEAELQWAEQARNQMLALRQAWLPDLPEEGVALKRGDGLDRSALQSWSDARDAWLGLSERWMDTVKAGMAGRTEV